MGELGLADREFATAAELDLDSYPSPLRLAPDDFESAVQEAMARHSPRFATIEMILRQSEIQQPLATPLRFNDEALTLLHVAAPVLSSWDSLLGVS